MGLLREHREDTWAKVGLGGLVAHIESQCSSSISSHILVPLHSELGRWALAWEGRVGGVILPSATLTRTAGGLKTVHMLRLSLPLLLSLVCMSASAQAPESLPDPQVEHSGEAYQRAAKGVTDKALQQLLARYDERLAQYPAEMPTVLERCRFLEGVSYDSEGEPLEPYVSLHTECVEELADTHAHDVRAVTYALENSYGEERIQIAREALRAAALSWSASDRAQFRAKLSQALEAQGDSKGAVEQAHAALKDDTKTDVSLVLARAAQTKGDKHEAKTWLMRGLESTPERQQLVEKARLLHALGAHAAAQKAIDLAAGSEGVHMDELLRAHILAASGRVDAARAAYKKLLASYQRPQVLSASFELELKHGSARQASAAYGALRDADFFNDPLLRHRFRLLWAHPAAGWHLRDALGALGIVALVLALFTLPMLLLVPVHYAGLVLRQHRGDMSYAPSAWSLKRVSLLLGAWLSVQILAAVTCAYGVMQEWMAEIGMPPPSDAELSAFALAFSIGGLLVVAAVIRPSEILRSLASAEDTSTTGARVVKGIGWTLLVAMANGLLVRGLSLGPFAEGAALAADITVRDILLAVQRNHGFGGVVFVAAVCAPLVEELIFRYALTDALEHHLSFSWANGLQALAFALCHDQWTFWPTLFFIGLFAGRIRRKSGSLIGSVGMHSMWNLLVSFAIAASAGRPL